MRLFDSGGNEIVGAEEIKKHMNDPKWKAHVEKTRKNMMVFSKVIEDGMCIHGISGDLHDSENYRWNDDEGWWER